MPDSIHTQRAGRPVGLPAAQRTNNVDLVGRPYHGSQVSYRLFVDKYFDVRTDAVLFIDNAKTQPRIAPIDIGQRLRKSRSTGLDDSLLVRIGSERGRNVDLH